MSRSAHLPPRCPLLNKSSPSTRNSDSSPRSATRANDFRVHHRRSPSHGSILEEQPSWLDELLSESDCNTKAVLHRRSASDSATLLECPTSFPALGSFNGDEGLCLKTVTGIEATEGRDVLEANFVYGPNSPRRKSNLLCSESSVVSALSELIPQSNLEYLPGDLWNGLEVIQPDAQGSFIPASYPDNEMIAAKRHSGQRSRVRKLQYIAELERTVNVLESMESELATKVTSLFQQRVILSVENSSLKHQITSLQKEKVIKEGQFKSLQNEIERLRAACSKTLTHERISYSDDVETSGETSLETSRLALDFGKLRLRENPVSLKPGFRS